MISAINSGMSMPLATQNNNQTLSSEQQTLISDTLAEFDPDNLTEEDALNIVETFSNAGIEPGSALESAISESGFDSKSIGDLVSSEMESVQGGKPPPPPPPPQDSEEISSMASYLEELLEEQMQESETDEVSEQARQDIYAKVMEKFGIEEGESLINTTA